MKKRIGGLIILILILLMGLAGCKKNQETSHTHDFGEWKVTRKAACETPGVETRTCECGEKEKKEIPATGHSEEKIEAIAATCTTEGKTAGTKCSVCSKVLEGAEVVPPTHQLKTLKAVKVTCTRAGKGEGAVCTLCGEVVTRQKKIRATGHDFQGDACTKCGMHLPDTAVALCPDQFNEAGPANFVTKEAYPGGTTLTFHVLLPKQGPWWGISWITDPAKANIYGWSENGSGTLLQAKAGEWTEVSVTLPEDGKNYYMFFMAEKGQWEGKEILVDDVTITDKNGKTIGTDTFDYGIDAGLFDVEKVNKDTSMAVVYAKERCAEHVTVADAAVVATCDVEGKTKGSHCSACGKVLVKQEILPALGHKWDENDICKTCGKEREDLVAVMVIDKLNEAAPMNFITKEAYPGGSTITFSAYAPAITKPDGNPSWWGISWTTDPSKVSLYDCHTPGMGKVTNTVEGTDWVDYTVTLPEDNNEYYIYFVGAKGEWQGKELEINNFAITSAAGKVLAEESFDDGVENGIFNVVATDYSEETVVYDRVLEVPCSKGHTTVTVPGKEPDCTNPGYTESSYCSVCGAVLVAQETIPAKGHDYDEITGECECGEKLMDRAVAINVDAMNDYSNMNFMTRQAYAGGSTISFMAYVPSGTPWWAISYTTDPTVGDLYAWAEKGYGAAQNSTYDTWKEYSLTLPDDENTYYFYIVGEKGQWGGKELLIDDVKITNKLGATVAEDDFNEGMHSGIFKIVENGYDASGEAIAIREEILGEICMHPESKWSKDADIDATCTDAGIIGATRCECGEVMIEEEVVPALGHDFIDGICDRCDAKESNKAAAITINKMGSDTGKMSFITKEAYPAGSTVTFDILIPENINSKWWGIGFATDPAKADLYAWCEGEQYGKTLSSTIGEWTNCSITLPEAEGNYYVYLVAAVGEWPAPTTGKDDTVFLIDNVVITDASGQEIASDNFNAGFEIGLFTVNPNGETAVSIYTLPEAEDATNRAAAITINKMGSATGKMSFITKEAYPAGSTVTFDILIPENINSKWWGIGFATDPAKADLYAWCEGEQYGKTLSSTIGEWTNCSIKLPEAEGNYYVYLVAAVGEWPAPATGKDDTVFLIDNVVIKDAGGKEIASDDFNTGLENGLFTVNPNGEKAVSVQVLRDELVDFIVEVDEGREPVILQLSDTQIIDPTQDRRETPLSQEAKDYWALDKMNERLYDSLTETIETTKPDLILLTGDLVYGEFDDSGAMFENLVAKMESFGIPWAPVFGNHENESAKGVDWQCEQLENAEHCLFKQRTLTGNGNYTVGIKQGENLTRIFFMMDSNGCGAMHENSFANGHSTTSVGFGQDQMDWSIGLAKEIKAASPDTKISYAFHIQIAAFTDAYAKYGFTNSGTKENPINIDKLDGKKEGDFGYLGRDLKNPWDSSKSFYARLKAVGVDSIFVGHEHCNSASVVYDGIRFQFGQKIGTYDRANFVKDDGSVYGEYCGTDTPISGGTVMVMAADGSFKDAYIYLTGDAQAKLDGTYEGSGIKVNGLQEGTDFDGDAFVSVTAAQIGGENAWKCDSAGGQSKVYVDTSLLQGKTTFTFSVYVPSESVTEMGLPTKPLFAIRVKPSANEPVLDGNTDGYIEYSTATGAVNKLEYGQWQTFTVDVTGLGDVCTEFAFNIGKGNVIYLKDIAFN